MTQEKQGPLLPEDADWITRVSEQSAHNMKNFESCSQSVLAAFMEELNIDDPLTVVKAKHTTKSRQGYRIFLLLKRLRQRCFG